MVRKKPKRKRSGKRRRLNKPVLIVLIALGAATLLAGLTMAYGFLRYGGNFPTRLVNTFLPKDPVVYERRGDEAYERKDYTAAASAYKTAVHAGETAQLDFKLARTLIQRAMTDQGMTDTDRTAVYRNGWARLQRAVTLDPSYIEPRQLLCDLAWREVRPGIRQLGLMGRQGDDPHAGQPKGLTIDQFVEMAQTLLDVDPHNAVLEYRLGLAEAQMFYGVKGKHDVAARKHLAAATRLKSDEPRYWVAMAEFLVSTDQEKEALAVLQTAVQKNPENLMLRVLRAERLWKGQRKEQAQKELRDAIEMAPKQVEGYLAMARIQRELGKLPDAEKTLTQARRNVPDDPRIYRELADIHQRAQQPRKAVGELRAGLSALARAEQAGRATEAIQIEQTRWRLEYALISVLLDLHYAGEKDRADLLAEAKTHLAAVVKFRPDGPNVAKLAGRVALAEGRNTEAIQLLEKAWKGLRNTTEQQAPLLLASLYLQRGQVTRAEQVVDRALRGRAGKSTRLLLAKAKIRMKLRAYGEANDLVQSVLGRQPDDAAAKALLADLRVLMDKTAKLPKAATPSRLLILRLRERADALWFDDRRAEAIELMADLNQRVPKDLAVASYLVDLCLAEKQIARADAVLKRAIAHHPDNEAIAFRRELIRQPSAAARIKLRIDRAEKTTDRFRRALELAAVHHIQGKADQHLKALVEAVRLKPAAPGLAGYALRRAISLREWNAADEIVKLAARADADGQKGKLFQANVAVARGRLDEAVKLLTAILKGTPDSARGRTLLGRCHLTAGRLDEAKRAFGAVAEADPSNVAAAVGMVEVTEGSGDRTEHARWVRIAYRLAPTDAYVRLRRLAVRADQAEKQQIPQLIGECARLMRKTSASRVQSIRAILAELYERSGRLSEAEGQYRLIHARAADKLAGARPLVFFLARTRQGTKADAVMRDVLPSTSDKVGAYVLYGRALSAYSPDLAMGAFSRALAVDEKDPRTHRAISKHLASRGDAKGAADAMARCVDLRGNAALEMELVSLLIQAARYDEANRRLTAIVARGGDNAAALTLQGFVQYKTGRIAEAEALLARAAKAGGAGAKPLVLRAQLRLDQGRAEPARADLDRARRQNKNVRPPSIAVQMAVAYRRLGDYAAAQMVLVDLRREHPNHLPALVELADLHLARRRWSDLEQLLGEARKAFPAQVMFARMASRMWRRRGKTDKALAACESAFKTSPDDTAVVREYVAALLDAREYDRVLQVTAGLADRPALGSWIHAVRGRALAKKGQSPQADVEFALALKRASGLAVYAVAGQVRQAYGPAESVRKCTAWCGARGGDWRTWACLGELHRLTGGRGLSKAAEALGKARDLADKPGSKTAVLRRLALALSHAGKHAESARAYEAALHIDPDDVHALNNLAYLYTNELDRPDQALPHARRAFELQPTDANVMDTYGWTLARLRKFDQAVQRLNQSILLGPPRPTSRYHLGWTMEHMPKGDLAGAHRLYSQGIVLLADRKNDPMYKILRQAADQVERKIRSGSRR